jgi:hypothetical protein
MPSVFPLEVKLSDERAGHTLKRLFVNVGKVKVEVKKEQRRWGTGQMLDDCGA